MQRNPSIHDLLGIENPQAPGMEQPGMMPGEGGGALESMLGAGQSPAPMAGAGGAMPAPPAQPAPAATSGKPDRFAMLEEEAYKMFSGEGPKRPDMKLKWNEILAAAINPEMLTTIFQRKMEPYHQQMEDERGRRQALDRLIQVYKMGPEPEKPTKPQGLMNVPPSGVVYDPQTRAPVYEAPARPFAPARDQAPRGFSPGTQIRDMDNPREVIATVPTRPEKPSATGDQRYEADERRYFERVKSDILRGMMSDWNLNEMGPDGKPTQMSAERKDAMASEIAGKALEDYRKRLGAPAGGPRGPAAPARGAAPGGPAGAPAGAPGGPTAAKPSAAGSARPTDVERYQQLRAQGVPDEQIQQILKAEGYSD